MTLPAFYPIFWNSAVSGAGGSAGYATIQSQMSAFAAAYLNGTPTYTTSITDDYNIVGQYNDSANHFPVPTAAVSSLGPFIDTKTTATSISDSQIQSYLAAVFGNNSARSE